MGTRLFLNKEAVMKVLKILLFLFLIFIAVMKSNGRSAMRHKLFWLFVALCKTKPAEFFQQNIVIVLRFFFHFSF